MRAVIGLLVLVIAVYAFPVADIFGLRPMTPMHVDADRLRALEKSFPPAWGYPVSANGVLQQESGEFHLSEPESGMRIALDVPDDWLGCASELIGVQVGVIGDTSMRDGLVNLLTMNEIARSAAEGGSIPRRCVDEGRYDHYLRGNGV